MNANKTVLLVLMASIATALRAADVTNFVTVNLNKDGLDYLGYPTNALVAVEKGRADARRDVSNGVYRVPTYGLAIIRENYDRILKERYNIHSYVLGGCIVSDGLTSYAKGYSEVSVAAIHARFGTNVFEQMQREAESGYPAASGSALSPVAPQLETHRVKPGETLSSIARQYGVSLDTLIEINPRIFPNHLQINQILVLPPRTEGK